MDLSTSQAAPDIRFFRNIGVVLAALTAIAGCITLTLSLSGDDPSAQVSVASDRTQPVTPE